MRIGRLQLNWNPQVPKVERKLALEKFYTFKDGTNAYTYQIADLARISGRYLDQVKNSLNFMLQYQAGPEQVKAFSQNIERKLMSAISEPDPNKRLEMVIEAREISKQMPRLQEYVDDLHKKMWHDLYVMFIVIDGEQEMLFTPKWNARKIELLDTEPPEVQELFFSFVQSVIAAFSDTYRSDLISSMVQERDLANLAASLTLLTNQQNMTSKSPDGEESASNNTGT